MEIKRTYKESSLKAGQVESVSYLQLRKILSQTDAAMHDKGRCGNKNCDYCPEVALSIFLKDTVIETFFSRFELTQ